MFYLDPLKNNQYINNIIEQPSIFSLPKEILLIILNELTPIEQRKIRATCLTFNVLLRELLYSKIDADFESLKEIVNHQLVPNGFIHGRLIAVIKSEAKIEEINSLFKKLISFRDYLNYLKLHHKKALNREELMFNYLVNSQKEIQQMSNQIIKLGKNSTSINTRIQAFFKC